MRVIGNSSVLTLSIDSIEGGAIKIKNTGLTNMTPVIDINIEDFAGTDIPITTAFTYDSIVPSAGSAAPAGAVLRFEPGLMVPDQEETVDFDITIVDITLFEHQFKVVATNTTVNDNPDNDIGYRTFNIIKCSDITLCDLTTVITKSYTYSSPGGTTGAFYTGGFYEAPVTSVALTQLSTTQTLGSVDNSYAAHAFIVPSGIGTASGGSGAVIIRVTGTSITDLGVRVPADSETISVDVTTLTTDEYLETSKKWVGQVTFILDVGATGHTAYAATFNYGMAKYEDIGNTDFTVLAAEVVGLAGASDTGFNVELLHHEATGWIYSAGAFVPGSIAIADMNIDHGTESNLVSGKQFAYERISLNEVIDGGINEGVFFRITTTSNNAVDFMDLHLTVQFVI